METAIRLKCWMKDHNANVSGYWSREITFPCFPYPGLVVGCHTVKKVYVCQGGLDGGPKAEISVWMKATTANHKILEAQGWKWE